MDRTIEFPATVDELRPELLSAVLAKRTPGVSVEGVEILATKYAGQGVASTADRVILELSYAPGSAGDLPRRMVLKTMLVAPHAPATMYETETRFYDELRPELDLEAPRAFGSHFAPESGRFGLLLEDLTERHARFPDATQPTSVAAITCLLDQLATIHARFWASPRLDRELQWVPTPASGGMADVFNEFGLALIESQLERHAFKRELIAPLGHSLNELWDMLSRVRREQTKGPTTLLHGDPHIGNTYLLANDRGGLLDWQLLTRGCFAHDVIYLLVTGLAPEIRRRHQHSLLEHYLSRLAELGATDVPDPETAWLLCRKASLWGLVIGWLITPPANYGVPITRENIQRAVTAIEDFDALATIG